jgi:CDP-diacylglycerol--glycerol-3-phosphate 3-phosphatidyltransferase
VHSLDRSWSRQQRRGWSVSLAITLLRLALAPTLIVLARDGAPGWLLACALVAGFVSDVVDGMVARHASAVTAFLRRLDSAVDTVFYLAVAYAAWILHPEPVRALAVPILIVIGGEALNYLAALLRFKREASYHAWSAKAWGLLLFLALLVLLGTGSAVLLPSALTVGMIAQMETLAITLVLPSWRHDVPSIWHAWRIRSDGRSRTSHDPGRGRIG